MSAMQQVRRGEDNSSLYYFLKWERRARSKDM
jgi:hypothetical protein